MKKYSSICHLVLLLVILSLFSACETDNKEYKIAHFKVWGNCEMCKDRIEKSVSEQEGVKSAEWDVKSKVMEVKYDSSLVDINIVHKKVAAVGHDTEIERGDDKAYASLHSCCQYTRKK